MDRKTFLVSSNYACYLICGAKQYQFQFIQFFRPITSVQMNSTDLNCADGIPSFLQLSSYITGLLWIIVLLPVVLSVCIFWVYSENLRNIMQVAPKAIKSNCLTLVSIYPIVSLCSLIAIAVPRTYFFMDTIGHVSFMIISYQLYR